MSYIKETKVRNGIKETKNVHFKKIDFSRMA